MTTMKTRIRKEQPNLDLVSPLMEGLIILDQLIEFLRLIVKFLVSGECVFI